MDAYPPDYVDHNLPLILLSGLGSDPEANSQDGITPDDGVEYPHLREGGVEIFSDFPLLTDSTAERVLNALLSQDATHRPWNARAGDVGYKIKRVGRTYTLPPRKGPVLPRSPLSSNVSGAPSNTAASPIVLHSPISPLTPSSPTFPDGIMTPQWVTKHQALIPSAFINFFPFTTDTNMASLGDNQLKIEINSLRKKWAASGYKTRFIVALLCDDGPLPEDANDRIAGIRMATNLDTKSIFVVQPEPSQLDISEFIKALFANLRGPSVEYYRDLSKHARRKKNRGTIPPPTAPPTSGTSQTLPLQGWNVRYDFKLGVFAEFRQEMDAACRSYEAAYEGLFGEEVFEMIAGWSPRFNDARMLADILSIRIIRCLLWTEQTSSAVHIWSTHKSRVKDIVDRRGKGTNNYGWEAWQARWSLVMAQIMHQAEISSLMVPDLLGSVPDLHKTIYAMPEKGIPAGGRIQPWEYLHHEGYWYRCAAQHTERRRQLAENIPDEDRVAPTQPTGSSSLSRATVYDNYLAPEPYNEYPISDHPGLAHSKLILGFLESSTEEFSKRQQNRIVEQLRLKMAKEHMRIGQWKDGLALIQPLWLQLSWRREGWWGLMEDFAWTLRECAVQAEDRETVLRVDWELMNHIFTMRQGWCYDIHKCIDNLPAVKPKPVVILKGEDSVSCLAASFVFAKSEGNVGEPLQSQLVIRSCAHAGSSPIRLTEVRVAFEGNIRPIKLLASENESSSSSSGCEIVPVSLQDSVNLEASTVQSPAAGLPLMVGVTNLSFGPKQTRAFNLVLVPREPGEAQVASITLRIEQENFDLSCVISEQNRDESVWWRMGKQGPISRRTGKDRDTSVSRILPKPPKVRISTPRSRNHYYTDEKVMLDVQIDNDEDDAAEVDVEIKLFGYTETSATFSWINETASDSIAAEDASPSSLNTPIEGGGSSTLSKRRTVGTLARGASRTLSILFTNTTLPLDYEVEISAFYHLVSDVETKIFKTVSLDLSFIRPFEANYEFLPRIHPAPWPDFFHYDDSPSEDNEEQEQKHNGLQQLWCLNSKIVSFALEPLTIEEVNVSLLGITAGNVCRIGTETLKSPEAPTIGPEGLRESEFTMEIQRLALNNRQPSTLNLALDIRWRRPDDDDNNDQQSSSSSQSTISTLPIPRFLVPLVEPRVLAHATPSATLPGFLHLDYTLENPSMHFLTFNITMEASDQFAFHGPKATTLQLVPLSRHTVRYNLLANVRGKWIQPQLVVVDSYFNKTLRVLPTEGMMGDKKGILVWVDADG
ncbi:hypothetical protein I7I50_03927 [Histoplasma capsulatum G186AR]|uniref:Uncharacterized protein n=1 Tax=Ajellomyces capsulatus TaxID=5037 RepID=A0A8H7YJH0_AJECA|nr:hypothetical protein I7I52_04835 [Histoplasma capsulatum]QSS74951.1 hypothetical protein I7I50_03927 [Histoplasma capsulatum G186AR]